MQKLYWLFCVMNITFLQSYYISQLLTIGHDCPVPVDKHGSVNFCFTSSLWPLRWGQRSNIKINQLSIFCTEFLGAGRGTIDMKPIKHILV